MVLTIELFTTHGRGANGSNCVCASVCVACAFGVRMSERGWWSQWSTQWREKGGKMRAGRMAASWVMFAKVKNHATVLRALDLPTGTSDYIHAGTQVLLNTPSLVLLPRQAPFHYLQPPPPLSPGPPQVWSRYKSLFAVQVPPHVFSAVARSLLSSSFLRAYHGGCVNLFVAYHKGHCALTSGDCISYTIAYYLDLIVCNNDVILNIISDRKWNDRFTVSSPVRP